jgi:hexosaminidase
MKKLIPILFVFICSIAHAQITIVPMPTSITEGKGSLNMMQSIVFSYKKQAGDGGIALFKKYLTSDFGITRIIDNDYNKNIATRINIEFDNTQKNDGYTLDVNQNSIKIKGNEKGVFYAFETLKQLFTKNNNRISLPICSIKDEPRFSYRGMHLDVSRHFFDVAYVKKYIDYLATYKYNTFHWHLTDDQGWRIEIKKYPNLTKVGGCRDRTLIGRYGSGKYDDKKYCEYYTQAQIKEIVQYATSRYITVIPEIEMPGHSTAALASYPFLGCTKGPYKTMDTWGVLDDVYCAGNDSTFTFIQNVLNEVMPLFPAPYIHIGGDECPKARWKKCAACQKRIKENNLKDEDALQSYFIQRIEKFVNSKGKKIIGWDEILEGGLAANATVMSWRGEAGGIEAAKDGHDVIMTPGSHCYLDHSQTRNEDSLTIGSFLPLDKIYNYEPIPAVLTPNQQTHVLGAQGNVWTEYIPNTSKLEYMIFPRMIALSEALWTSKENKSWADFEKRLPVILERLDRKKINYSKAYYDLEISVLPTTINEGVSVEVKRKKIPNTFLLSSGITAASVEKFTIINYDRIKGFTDFIESNLYYKSDLIPYFSLKELNYLEKDTSLVFKLPENKLPPSIKSISSIKQKFFLNKATGKKITISTKPNEPYVSDGAFTLVNGIQNTKGMAKSTEFLGFNGKDVEVTIDFGKDVEISTIKVHCLDKNNSWIYLPSNIEVTPMPFIDTTVITKHPPLESTSKKITDNNNVQIVNLPEPKLCRSVRIFIKNYGIIPGGNAGEGKPAWVFVDEIEVE